MSQSPSTESTLADLDVAIDTAMSDRDAPALERLLAPDFIYTHSNGRPQPRAEFIGAIAARDNPPRRILTDVQVELHDDVAVTRGNLDIVYHDDRPNLYMRYVRVWRQTSQQWHAISHRTVYAQDRG